MPWRVEAMKDVVRCDKLGWGANNLRLRDFWMGKPTFTDFDNLRSSERIIHCAWTPNNEIEVNRITLLVGTIDHLKNLKNQALQGFLVNALAHRGDERRDTLR